MNKNLYYCTKKNVYQITKNDDGTVTFYPEDKNAGMIIMQRGGVQGFLSACIEDERDYEAFCQDFQRIKEAKEEHRSYIRNQNAKVKAEAAKRYYLAMLEKYEGKAIDTTAENLRILMRYLQTINWGVWELPRLTQGYSANQYDCDGKTAVTITLDQGIESDGKIIRKLQYGAPIRYLPKYAPVVRL